MNLMLILFILMNGIHVCIHLQLFSKVANSSHLKLFDNGIKDQHKQAHHSMEAAKLLEHDFNHNHDGP
jgi:hypothetical protein